MLGLLDNGDALMTRYSVNYWLDLVLLVIVFIPELERTAIASVASLQFGCSGVKSILVLV